ncbi:MAG TPA: Wzz/FepE/Etk N-terminal domain-containing protein [Burkholderiales bacterium]|nr:Wzz/FepE/Etk N-terminal domain-containing protein [Burkholderiales bacterium]
MTEGPISSDYNVPHDARARTAEDDEISLVDFLLVFARYKKQIMGVPLIAAVAAAALSLLMPNIYTGTARVLPPQQTQSAAAAMLAQIGTVVGIGGGSAAVRNPSDLYVGMLKSRTVADNLIARFDLMKRYGVTRMSDARERLAGVTTFASGKDGIIAVEVDDEDPKVAADLANAYVDELLALTKVLAVTEAAQRRLFFEQQFAQVKEELAKSESAARQALQQRGLVKVDDQARAMVETTARLRAQISLKEVQIGAMRSFASERNPELVVAQQELDSLRRELGRIEGAGTSPVSASGSDGKGLENLRLLRDLRYNEVLYELMARQYEIARIDEAREASILQVLDKAVQPDRKSKPKRSLIVVFVMLSALIAVLLWIAAREALIRASADPVRATKLDAFKRSFSWR